MAFFEISFDAQEFLDLGFTGRDQLEDPLDEALRQRGFGEVTGGGTGLGITNIDVESDEQVESILVMRLIAKVLRGNNAPRSTLIKEYEPSKHTWNLYEIEGIE